MSTEIDPTAFYQDCNGATLLPDEVEVAHSAYTKSDLYGQVDFAEFVRLEWGREIANLYPSVSDLLTAKPVSATAKTSSSPLLPALSVEPAAAAPARVAQPRFEDAFDAELNRFLNASAPRLDASIVASSSSGSSSTGSFTMIPTSSPAPTVTITQPLAFNRAIASALEAAAPTPEPATPTPMAVVQEAAITQTTYDAAPTLRPNMTEAEIHKLLGAPEAEEVVMVMPTSSSSVAAATTPLATPSRIAELAAAMDAEEEAPVQVKAKAEAAVLPTLRRGMTVNEISAILGGSGAAASATTTTRLPVIERGMTPAQIGALLGAATAKSTTTADVKKLSTMLAKQSIQDAEEDEDDDDDDECCSPTASTKGLSAAKSDPNHHGQIVPALKALVASLDRTVAANTSRGVSPDEARKKWIARYAQQLRREFGFGTDTKLRATAGSVVHSLLVNGMTAGSKCTAKHCNELLGASDALIGSGASAVAAAAADSAKSLKFSESTTREMRNLWKALSANNGLLTLNESIDLNTWPVTAIGYMNREGDALSFAQLTSAVAILSALISTNDLSHDHRVILKHTIKQTQARLSAAAAVAANTLY